MMRQPSSSSVRLMVCFGGGLAAVSTRTGFSPVEGTSASAW